MLNTMANNMLFVDGDFDGPQINWDDSIVAEPYQGSSRSSYLFVQINFEYRTG